MSTATPARIAAAPAGQHLMTTKPMEQYPLLLVDNVTKSFGHQVVLDHVSFAIFAGETVAVVGPSGCGKSTLFNIVGMLESPDSGAVSLCGASAPRITSKQGRFLLRHRIGFLFLSCVLAPNCTVEQNLKIAQIDSKDSASRYDALEKVGLAGAEGCKARTLSSGEQQRLAIAKLLVKPCDLILADEPTGSLDAATRDTTLEYMTVLQDQGKTILVFTHDDVVGTWAETTLRLG